MMLRHGATPAFSAECYARRIHGGGCWRVLLYAVERAKHIDDARMIRHYYATPRHFRCLCFTLFDYAI